MYCFKSRTIRSANDILLSTCINDENDDQMNATCCYDRKKMRDIVQVASFIPQKTERIGACFSHFNVLSCNIKCKKMLFLDK